MKLCDIRESSLTVYRVLNNGSVQGYALHPPEGFQSQPMTEVDPNVDYVDELQVHVFGSRREVHAFLDGLSVAGEDSVYSISAQCGELWVVLREVRNAPDKEDESTVRVMTYSERPRALVTVRGGVAELATDEPDLDLLLVDYDDDPNAKIPERFSRLLD